MDSERSPPILASAPIPEPDRFNDHETQPTPLLVESRINLPFQPVVNGQAISGVTGQWRKDGIDLVDGGKVSGAANAVLTISDAQGNEMGTYSVIVSNASGEAQSVEAVLAIVPLMSWGFNEFGAGEIPSGLSNVVSVAAGYEHSLAVRTDGTVVGWGNNSEGQSEPPSGLANVRSVATGWKHSLALRSDGTVVVWGNDHFGQATVPDGLSNVVAVSAGWNYSAALRANGTVAVWGVFDERGIYLSTVPEGLTT